MRKIFWLATILVFVTSFAQASANSMPVSEMYVGGVGYGTSLGYVKEIYGEPVDKRTFTGDGVRIVAWIYSEYFSVTARTGADDFSPEEDLPVVSFTLKNNSLSTPSGLTVGMNYNEVVKMWGRGEYFESEGGRSYFYVPADSQIPMTLTFYVDADATITEIQLGTDF